MHIDPGVTLARVLILLPPSPRYDDVRDVLVSGLLLSGSLIDYIVDEDALLVEGYEVARRRGILSRLLHREQSTLEPRLEEGRVKYGAGGLVVYERLEVDAGLSYREPKPREGLIVAIDWRHLLYHTINELKKSMEALIDALSSAPSPRVRDAKLIGHAYALLAASRLAGLDKDIRVILAGREGSIDSGIIPSSTYRILSFVDRECLEELESMGLDALRGVDTDSLEYLATAVENRDTYALRHMLRRMGCRVMADELIAPADILG